MKVARVVGWAAAALAVGAAISLLKLWIICRDPISEACVWGKALLPLGLPIEAVVFGAGAFVLAVGGRSLARSSSRSRDGRGAGRR